MASGIFEDAERLQLLPMVTEEEAEECFVPVEYEMGIAPGIGPYIKHRKSGQLYLFEWHDLLLLAVNDGLQCEEDGNAP